MFPVEAWLPEPARPDPEYVWTCVLGDGLAACTEHNPHDDLFGLHCRWRLTHG